MGFLDFMFGGKEEQDNPMRHWAHYGPTAVSSYYDQAILDAQKQTGQYWGIWHTQMSALERLFNQQESAWNKQKVAWDNQYNASKLNIESQRDELDSWKTQQLGDLNRQFDRAVDRANEQADDTRSDINKEERRGRNVYGRKALGAGLQGSSAAEQWKSTVTKKADEARSDVTDTLNDVLYDYDEQRMSGRNEIENRYQSGVNSANNALLQLDTEYANATAQRAMGEAQFGTNWTQMVLGALGGAPIGVDATNELQFRKAQELYGTPWEQYAQPIVTETSGMFQDVILPAAFGAFTGGLGSALGSAAGGGLSSMFGNLFSGGGGASVDVLNNAINMGGQSYGLTDFAWGF